MILGLYLYRLVSRRLLNRLWVRLSLAFILITQLSVFMVAELSQTTVASEFQQYVYVSGVNQTSVILRTFYNQSGTWNGVDKLFASGSISGTGSGKLVSQSGGTVKVAPVPGPLPLMLANAQGEVVYDSTNKQVGLPLPADQLKMAIPLSQNNAPANVFGYLLSDPSAAANIVGFGPSPTARLVQPGTIEDQFLAKIQNLLYIAALVGLLGVIFALVIARTLIAPLNQLEQAARTFANRDWTYRIAHQGTHELAAVASAFNNMADQLERAESLRRNLVADIAHELRTPLSVMQANLMALLDGLYPLDKREIATLYEETCMLSRLVSDLRELAQADAGQLDLKPDRINVRMLIQNVTEKFAATAETEGTQLFMLPCAEDWTIRADNGRVTQVLGNLVANALQHTPGGTVILSAEKQEKGARQSPLIRISVTDNGSGISPADILHVFDRFYRADKSRTRAHGNSGLGLAIAKAWIEAMGGQINVESIHGKGSRFWFTLPMCK